MVVLAAVVGSSCNALVDTDTEQCKTDADCQSKGGAFATATCRENACVVEPCSTNQECLDRNGGTASICRRPDNVCVELIAPDCTEVFLQDALPEDQTIVIGFMGPLTGVDASSGIPTWEGVKLALNEIETAAKGLPLRGGTQRRRLAALACDDANDPIMVAKHLAEVVGVPVVVGPNFSGVSLEVATKVTIEAGTLLISPSATSPTLTDLADNGLFWRTAPSDALQAVPMAKLVADLETQIRTEQSLQPTASIRVAMIVKGDAYGTGLADASTAKMSFNGKPASANGNDFVRIDYPDPNDGHDWAQDHAKIWNLKPHIVIAIGTTEAINDVLIPLEKDWSAKTGNAPKPYHAISDGGRTDELLAAVVQDPGLRTRAFGTFPGRTTLQYQDFEQRFKAFFNGKVPGSYASNAYDGAYVVAYALVSAAESIPTGAGVNEGLKHTVGGSLKVLAGAAELNTKFKPLFDSPDGKIDYDGVSGPLDFDPNTGEAPADIDVWCIDTANAFVSSGQYYDAVTGKVVGAKTACN